MRGKNFHAFFAALDGGNKHGVRLFTRLSGNELYFLRLQTRARQRGQQFGNAIGSVNERKPSAEL